MFLLFSFHIMLHVNKQLLCLMQNNNSMIKMNFFVCNVQTISSRTHMVVTARSAPNVTTK